jgi:hypothetical protein
MTELWQLIATKVQDIERCFVEQHENELENAITALKNIASSSPGNIQAAEALTKSLSESMIHALLERSMEILQRTLNTPDNGLPSQIMDAASIQDPANNSAMIRQLMVQNETLKASLKQMRKRNTELRTKAAASSLGIVSRKDAGDTPGSATSLEMNQSGTKVAAISSSVPSRMAASSAPNTGTSELPLDDNTLISMEIMPLPMELESKFDYLNEDIRGVAWTALLGHVVQMMEGEAKFYLSVRSVGLFETVVFVILSIVHCLYDFIINLGHPLVSEMRLSVLQEGAVEIAMQARGLLGNALGALITRGDLVIPLDTPEGTPSAMAEEIIGKLLQTTPLHMEIVALVTMTVTYLYARYLKAPSKAVSSSAGSGPAGRSRSKTQTSSASSLVGMNQMSLIQGSDSSNVNYGGQAATPSLKQAPRTEAVPRYMQTKKTVQR